MDSNICTRCNTKKVLKIFTTHIPNVKIVTVTDVKIVTMRIKIKYQIKKIYDEKNREKVL